jgi:hypothetical protein
MTGADYLAEILRRFTGIRRIDKAKLFFPEEYPDIIAEEAWLLWERGGQLYYPAAGAVPPDKR